MRHCRFFAVQRIVWASRKLLLNGKWCVFNTLLKSSTHSSFNLRERDNNEWRELNNKLFFTSNPSLNNISIHLVWRCPASFEERFALSVKRQQTIHKNSPVSDFRFEWVSLMLNRPLPVNIYWSQCNAQRPEWGLASLALIIDRNISRKVELSLPNNPWIR